MTTGFTKPRLERRKVRNPRRLERRSARRNWYLGGDFRGGHWIFTVHPVDDAARKEAEFQDIPLYTKEEAIKKAQEGAWATNGLYGMEGEKPKALSQKIRDEINAERSPDTPKIGKRIKSLRSGE